MISDAIQLPDAPGLPGLRFRHFRGGDDYSHMATITRISAEVDPGDRASLRRSVIWAARADFRKTALVN